MIGSRRAMLLSPAPILALWAAVAGAQEARRDLPPPEPPKPPQLTAPPELIEAATPVYPPEAAAAGLKADVVVRIKIDATGAVIDAAVVQPVGNGFDEAAVEAARQYRFKPAEWDGKPGPITVETTIHFVLEEAEPEPPPTPPAPPPWLAPTAPPPESIGPPSHGGDARQPIAIEGSARERGTRRRLAGVQVAVVELGLDAVTDEEGRFYFHGVPPGTYELVAVDPDHARFRRSLSVAAGEAVDLVLWMRARGGNPYETVVEGDAPALEVTRRTLTRHQLTTVPGTFGDPIRVIQTLPGLARAPFSSGLLVVRGSNPDDTGIFVDGHRVPLLFHFLGGPSFLNPEFLDKLDLYPGGFPARYGRAIGGIVSVETRSPKSDGVHGAADVDVLDSGGYLRVPLGKKGGLAVAGRRSYLDFMLGFFLPEPDAGDTLIVVPVYWDYQARLDYDLGKNGSLTVFGFGSDDKLDVVQADADTEESLDLSSHIGFSRIMATYRRPIAGKLQLTLSPSYGHDVVSFTGAQAADSPTALALAVSQTATSYRMRIDGPVRHDLHIDVGLDLEARVTNYQALAPDDSDVRTRGQVDIPSEQIERSIDGSALGLYADLAWDVGGGVRLLPSLRADAYLLTGQERVSIDPRLVARWAVTPKWTAKAYAGVFHQAPQPEGFDSTFGNPELGLERAIQTGLGGEWRPSRWWLLDGEVYYIDRSDLAVFTNDGVMDPETGQVRRLNFANFGDGFSYGLELLIKREISRNFYGWLSYTLSHAERRRAADEQFEPTNLDQTHNLNLVASWRTDSGWELGARFILTSGRPDSAITGSTYDVDRNDYVPVVEDFRGIRTPTFYQLDTRIEKTWTFRTWMMGAYVNVLNTLDIENIEAVQYDYRYRASSPITSVPLVPTIGIRGEW